MDLGAVLAVSASGQQHASVYWKVQSMHIQKLCVIDDATQTGSAHLLATLQPAQSLHEQLASAFSVAQSPIWMDSS